MDILITGLSPHNTRFLSHDTWTHTKHTFCTKKITHFFIQHGFSGTDFSNIFWNFLDGPTSHEYAELLRIDRISKHGLYRQKKTKQKQNNTPSF